MYLLDTNVCIAIVNNHPQALSQFTQKSNLCIIPTIVQAELYKGAYCSQRLRANLAILDSFMDLIEIINFAQTAALEFGKIQSELRQIGRPTGEIDA